jgi:hypothetical protein
VALVDAPAIWHGFVLLPGQRHDSIGVEPLITDVDFEALIADKAFDNNALRTELDERGALAVIPSKADRKAAIPYDEQMYTWRHLNRELLPEVQGVPAYRHALRQDRQQLRCCDLSRGSLPSTSMNVSRP